MEHIPAPRHDPSKAPIRVAIQRQMNVMHAVILRDIRSRFFNHGLGFLIQPMMPVAHVLIVLSIYKINGRTAVFGDDLFLFFATGMIPSLTFTYISRFMSASLIANKSMLAFPAVHLLDIVLARSFLEFNGIIISVFVMSIILLSLGIDPYPRSPTDALLAMFFVSMVAIGVGIIVSVITAIFPFFALPYSLFMVVVYLSAGGPIYLHALPEEVVYYCTFNPVFHAVSWMRSAYYLGYPVQDLDKTYLIGWAIGSIGLGLLMERTLKRFVMTY